MSGSATASSWCAAISSMDVILPYVAWITLLAFLLDLALGLDRPQAFPWAYVEEPR